MSKKLLPILTCLICLSVPTPSALQIVQATPFPTIELPGEPQNARNETVNSASMTAGAVVLDATALVSRSELQTMVPASIVSSAEIATALAEATQVVAGDHHTCALTRTGGIKCWGLNAYRQLDDGGWSYISTIPVDVPGLSTGVTAIAASEDYACAITAGGGVKCWFYPYSPTPVNVTGLTAGVTAIAAGAHQTCALTSEGGVKCWGYNFGENTPPTDVSGLTVGATAIAAGEGHTCAVTSEGGVKCWGQNADGQLGDGTTTSSNIPVGVSGLTAGVTTLSAGRNHTCAVAADGGVRCWGDNYNGQLGDGTHVNRAIPITVSGLSVGITAVTAGDQHTCALTTSGGVKCWGASGYGQLGDGTTTSSATPVNVSDMATDATVIVAGAYHTCAIITNGGIKCWGKNAEGQLGNGSSDDHSVPGDVSGLTASAIVAGDYHSCALVMGGGVRCWGRNDSGQVGDGTVKDRALPVNVSDLAVMSVHAIGAGSDHTCALIGGGGVKCWGNNGSGQLGNGATSNSSTPVTVGGLNEGVTAIAAGQSHTCALTLVGGVKCWGNNFFGQLGDGTTVGRLNPTVVNGLTTGATAITAGTSHTCVLTAGGGVKCWGLGSSGQLGYGNTLSRSTPVDVIGLGSGVMAIAAGDTHTCALTTAGGIECWGDNSVGQLGDGTQSGHLTPVAVEGLAAIATAVTAGTYHTCAITNGGGIKCWGANGAGRLGDGTTTDHNTPVSVRSLTTGISAISAGDSHTCALMTTGNIKCWGANYAGQLGINPGWTPGDVIGFGRDLRATYLPILLR